jgi:hypothetical protein
MKAVHLTIALGLLASAACSKPPKSAVAKDERQGMVKLMDTGQARPASRGPDGMGMMMMMQAHTDSMAKMSPEQMTRVMARHERMMSQMMDQMGGEMRQMQMAETADWSALADSVRQDLAELPGLSGNALSSRMQAHAARVRRLIAMHKRMIGGM